MTEPGTVHLFATEGADRVRAHTDPDVQARLDDALVARIREVAAQAAGAGGRAVLTRRIEELEAESDMERTLEANAAVLAFTGTVLAAVHHRRWLVVPGVVTAFLFQHAIQGWCPPVAVFRRLGVRTAREISAERFALKALRGDFAGVDATGDPDRTTATVLRAVGG